MSAKTPKDEESSSVASVSRDRTPRGRRSVRVALAQSQEPDLDDGRERARSRGRRANSRLAAGRARGRSTGSRTGRRLDPLGDLSSSSTSLSTRESLVILQNYLAECERNLVEGQQHRDRLAQMVSFAVEPTVQRQPIDYIDAATQYQATLNPNCTSQGTSMAPVEPDNSKPAQPPQQAPQLFNIAGSSESAPNPFSTFHLTDEQLEMQEPVMEWSIRMVMLDSSSSHQLSQPSAEQTGQPIDMAAAGDGLHVNSTNTSQHDQNTFSFPISPPTDDHVDADLSSQPASEEDLN